MCQEQWCPCPCDERHTRLPPSRGLHFSGKADNEQETMHIFKKQENADELLALGLGPCRAFKSGGLCDRELHNRGSFHQIPEAGKELPRPVSEEHPRHREPQVQGI